MVEAGFGFLGRDCEGEGLQIPKGVGAPRTYELQHIFGHRIRRTWSRSGYGGALVRCGEALAILGVEVPGAAGGRAIFQQQIVGASHLPVKELHA